MQINRVKNSSEENQYMISENYSRTTYIDIYNDTRVKRYKPT